MIGVWMVRAGVPLLFSFDGPETVGASAAEEFVDDLNRGGDWQGDGVVLVNEVEHSSVTRPGDEPIWTLGGVLWLEEPRTGTRERRLC